MTLILTLGSLGWALPARAAVGWQACPDDIPNLPLRPDVQCATLTLPVDWARPGGQTFGLVIARHQARKERVGTLIFGPGGPGDSGVERIRRMDRFSDELMDRFDIVSFDPRGVARSAAPRCTPDPALPKPPLLLTSQADFDAAVRYHQAFWASCESPVFGHADTASAVRDLDAIRRALGESRLTFQGSSYGTLLGQQYAERYPGRVRAIMLDGVFDHSLDVRGFVRLQASTLQDSFDEFVTWCARSPADCPLRGDVRAIWAGVLARADRGDYAPSTAFDIALLPLIRLSGPDHKGFAQVIDDLTRGIAPPPRVPPIASAVFCADGPAQVRNYRQYAHLVREARAAAKDVRYGAGLLAVQTCLGWPQPVRNPPHDLRVTGPATLLLLNARHDPRTGYAGAAHVAAQLGRHGRLVTYDGWGHGAYLRTPCTIALTDRYLIDLEIPAPAAHCPVVTSSGQRV